MPPMTTTETLTPEYKAIVKIAVAALHSLYHYVDAEHGPRRPGTFLFRIMDRAKFALDLVAGRDTLTPPPLPWVSSPLPWVRADRIVPDSERDIIIMLDGGYWQTGRFNVANYRFERSGGGKLHANVTHWLDIDPPADAVQP